MFLLRGLTEVALPALMLNPQRSWCWIHLWDFVFNTSWMDDNFIGNMNHIIFFTIAAISVRFSMGKNGAHSADKQILKEAHWERLSHFSSVWNEFKMIFNENNLIIFFRLLCKNVVIWDVLFQLIEYLSNWKAYNMYMFQ